MVQNVLTAALDESPIAVSKDELEDWAIPSDDDAAN